MFTTKITNHIQEQLRHLEWLCANSSSTEDPERELRAFLLGVSMAIGGWFRLDQSEGTFAVQWFTEDWQKEPTVTIGTRNFRTDSATQGSIPISTETTS